MLVPRVAVLKCVCVYEREREGGGWGYVGQRLQCDCVGSSNQRAVVCEYVCVCVCERERCMIQIWICEHVTT